MPLTTDQIFLLGLFLFWIILYALSLIAHTDKHGLKIFPFFLMYRSERFKNTISRIGQKNSLLWKTLGNISTALGLGLLIYVTYFLVGNLVKFFTSASQSVPITPIIPAVTISLDSLPYFFVAVAIIVVLHELAHGVGAISEKVPVKSAGLAVMLAFFGGFVEPEEQGFEKTSKTSKLRILSAGSAINLVTGILVLVLMLSMFAPSSGVLIEGTLANGPLANHGVTRFEVIYAINGTPIESVENLSNYLSKVKPGETLTVDVNHNNITLVTENLTGRAVIGVSPAINYYPLRFYSNPVVSANVFLTFYWTYVAAFSVAIFNMLPAVPFDGDKFLYSLLEDRVQKNRRVLLHVLINAIFWGLLLANFVLSFVHFGLPQV